MRQTIFITLILVAINAAARAADHDSNNRQPWDQWAISNPDWVEPVAPFKVIDNIYYVGTRGISSFLLTSKDGHVLIDGGMPQNAPLIVNSVEALGFEITDVKILLNTHAHFDHSGGLAELKALTGAMMISSVGDRKALETGLYAGSDNPSYSAPAVEVDKTVNDGELIELSSIKLKANLMPGHSPGCTSWSARVTGRDSVQTVLFFCSATVAGNRLVGPPQYPGIVQDYRRTFSKSKGMRVDVLLANHPFFSAIHEKRAKVLEGNADAFIDSTEFAKLMQRLEVDFEKKLAEQTAKLKQD